MKHINPLVLLKEAGKAARQSYARYSKYRVGAALLDSSGNIFLGCNIENASYGLTICAERVAIFSAIADGKRKFKALAIVASGRILPAPCGACRQVLSEFCAPGLPVYFASAGNLKAFKQARLSELLPAAFKL